MKHIYSYALNTNTLKRIYNRFIYSFIYLKSYEIFCFEVSRLFSIEKMTTNHKNQLTNVIHM